jgi:plasmid stabilization system protein ParE
MSFEIPEILDPSFREIYFGQYRIIFRYRDNTVLIMAVWHASNPLIPSLILRDT